MYYIVGFLGNQAENHAKRMAKESGRQDCMLHFVQARFAVRNKGEEAAVKKLIANKYIPTEMMEKCKRLGGLCYLDVICCIFSLFYWTCVCHHRHHGEWYCLWWFNYRGNLSGSGI